MAALAKASVSLRIVGDDLEPEDVTRLLATPPTHSARKGDARATPAGGFYAARTGYWNLRVAPRALGDLDRQIGDLLRALPSDPEVWSELGRRFRCELFCGLFMDESNEGIDLAPETLVMIGERRLRLDFDLYGPRPA